MAELNSDNNASEENISSKEVFEECIINLFKFLYERSKETQLSNSVFYSEYDIQAFMFMQLFNSFKEKNILFNKDGHLTFGINRKSQNTRFEKKKIWNKIFDEKWSIEEKLIILNFLKKMIKK